MTETEIKGIHNCVKVMTPHDRAWVSNRDVMGLVAEVRRLQDENAELAKAKGLTPMAWTFGDDGEWIASVSGFNISQVKEGKFSAYYHDDPFFSGSSVTEAKAACEQYRRELIAALRGEL